MKDNDSLNVMGPGGSGGGGGVGGCKKTCVWHT